jgi:N-dimethylarginine dimethylaminohydrolase
MCAPVHFDVTDKSNPWMRPGHEVDREAAMSQWHTLVDVYQRLGHRVSYLDPVQGLPDMVFTANGAVVVDGRAFVARFRSATRQPESAAHKCWLESTGAYTVAMSEGIGVLPLDTDTIAYYAGAFSAGSRRLLQHMYPDAVLATAEDAGHLGLNAISDGHHVVLPADSANFADRLLDRGYEPIPVDLSEFRASGGGQNVARWNCVQRARHCPPD